MTIPDTVREEVVREFNSRWPLPRILALSGGKGAERDAQNRFLREMCECIATLAYASGVEDSARVCRGLQKDLSKPTIEHAGVYNNALSKAAAAIRALTNNKDTI